MDISILKTYYDKAYTELSYFRPIQADIYDHCISSKNNWRSNSTVVGERTDLKIYNSHPQTVTKQFADNMVSLVMPTGTRFFDLDTSDRVDNIDEFRQNVEGISNQILDFLNDSNFYQAVTESFLDLTAGTGGITVNFSKELNRLYFTSLDMSKVSFLEDNFGRISYVFHNLGVLNKVSQSLLFPDINFGVDNIELLECIYPIDNGFMYIITDTVFSKVYKQVRSIHNPFIIFRWSKRSGENRGRGILHDLIGLIKMTNIMARDVLDASALVISPPVIATGNSNLNPNNLRVEPNSIITIDNIDGIKPFPTSSNLPFAYQAIAQNNTEIDNAFMANILGQASAKEMTATEVNARMQLANNVLGAFNNRFQQEFLNPLFPRIIEVLTKSGNLDPTIIGGKKIKLKYHSPITNLDKTIRLQRLLQSIQTVVQATGDLSYVSSSFKLDKLALYSAQSLGADLSMLNTQDEIDNNLQEIIRQKQQQKAMQQLQTNPALNQSINFGGVPSV